MATSRGLGHFELIFLLSTITALTALAIDLILPAFAEIREGLGLSQDSPRVAAVVTSFFFGLASLQMVYGPLSDRFGRRPILYVGLLTYAIGAVGSAVSPSLEFLLLSRFLWGVGAAGSRVITVAIVRDSFEGDRMARVMSLIMAVFIVVPVSAPALGALIISVGPWRWLFWFCVLFVVAVGLWAVRLPETLAPGDRVPLVASDVAASVRFVLTRRRTVGYTLASTFLFGAFASYLATSELVVSEVFDRGRYFPLIFGAVAATMGAGMLANAKLLIGRYGAYRTMRRALASYTAAATGMVLLATSSESPPPFWAFFGILALALASHAVLLPNLNTLAMGPVGKVAGTASSIIGTITTAGGAALGSIIDRAFDGTVVPLSTGCLVCALAALGLVLWTDRSNEDRRGNGS